TPKLVRKLAIHQLKRTLEIHPVDFPLNAGQEDALGAEPEDGAIARARGRDGLGAVLEGGSGVLNAGEAPGTPASTLKAAPCQYCVDGG
ncbi:hypothetical protein V496_10200, partial [Pseudogymnoascus sp. VKM F-4515 (FW-2607)]